LLRLKGSPAASGDNTRTASARSLANPLARIGSCRGSYRAGVDYYQVSLIRVGNKLVTRCSELPGEYFNFALV
jgi:hypothetical protein